MVYNLISKSVCFPICETKNIHFPRILWSRALLIAILSIINHESQFTVAAIVCINQNMDKINIHLSTYHEWMNRVQCSSCHKVLSYHTCFKNWKSNNHRMSWVATHFFPFKSILLTFPLSCVLFIFYIKISRALYCIYVRFFHLEMSNI